jgi:ParB-like chromosome segregation protein Spo0J
MIIKVHKDKITFKNSSLRTEEGRSRQKNGEFYKQIKISMEKHGMINPLICIKDGDMYKICLGMKRFIIGCDLGMQEFDVKVVPTKDSSSDIMSLEEIVLLKEENLKFKPTDADNAYFKSMKLKKQ